MVKKRPVLVVSVKLSHGRRLCTVVPFSTSQPDPVETWHHSLAHVRIPGLMATAPMWAKCDMVATVSFERMNKPYVKTRHGRAYRDVILHESDLLAIEACLRSYLGL